MLNLETKKVTKGTAKLIRLYVYENREQLGWALKLFYSDIAGMIDRQLLKPAASRLSMAEIMERVYNIESYILAAGAVSYEVVRA